MTNDRPVAHRRPARRALTRRGEIPTVKLGEYYRYRLDEIEAFERWEIRQADYAGHNT